MYISLDVKKEIFFQILKSKVTQKWLLKYLAKFRKLLEIFYEFKKRKGTSGIQVFKFLT